LSELERGHSAAVERPSREAIRSRNAIFREEAARFRLVYRCGDCAHVVASSGACSLGYPNARLRHSENAVEDDGQFMFCKYFEADA
jgi:hypothetical protein